jgi:hypothetical protein
MGEEIPRGLPHEPSGARLRRGQTSSGGPAIPPGYGLYGDFEHGVGEANEMNELHRPSVRDPRGKATAVALIGASVRSALSGAAS